jgi:hypothetical protein
MKDRAQGDAVPEPVLATRAAPSRARGSRIPRVGALVLATPILALAFGEAVLRARGFDPLGAARRSSPPLVRRSTTPGLEYELVPGASGAGWGSEVRLSSAGMRDREYARSKPPGVRRVAVLGDSLTFGTGLSAEQTYPDVLEERLRADRVEVLNFGVGGYDVADDAAVLEHAALAYEPDLVLVGYCVNDVGVHSVNLESLEGHERFSSPLYRLRVAQWLAREAERRRTDDWSERVNRPDEFTRRFDGRLSPIGGDAELERIRATIAEHAARAAGDPFLGWYADREKLARLRWALRRIAELARSSGADVLVVFLPYPAALELPQAYASVRELVARECELAGVAFDDPWPEFAGMEAGELHLNLAESLHVSALAHAKLAARLEPLVRAALAP